MNGPAGRLSVLGRPLPPEFELRTVALAPGRTRPYDEHEWRDALVVVERGEIELERLTGARRRFRAGAVLWLAGLPLRALRNPGPEPAVLAAVSRLVAVAPVDPSLHDRFFLVQRIRPMVNQYEVSTLGADGKSPGEPVCFVEQKRMKLKEDLRAFADDSKTTEVFRIKAQQIWDPRARYDVTDPSGGQIGQLAKVFGRSLLRSTWRIYGSDGSEVAWARERNLIVALVRRFIGLVPFIGGFADWVPIPYHFDYFAGKERIGGLERILGVRDRYRLDVSGDSERAIDRRVVLALAVGMDALQAR
jgi:uncharacterized protein YxjI/quercetin dioxygenase-like cupin family protein